MVYEQYRKTAIDMIMAGVRAADPTPSTKLSAKASVGLAMRDPSVGLAGAFATADTPISEEKRSR